MGLSNYEHRPGCVIMVAAADLDKARLALDEYGVTFREVSIEPLQRAVAALTQPMGEPEKQPRY